MNRLTKRLADLKKQNKKALVAYLVAGDPDIESTLQLMNLFVESGVDVLEIGVPFTDPIAEGPIIQKAHDRALEKNISLTAIFEMVQKFRETDNTTPIVLMGYLNTFLSHKKIIEENKKDSVDSILVVDIPGELNLADYGIKNQNINTISLISPTTNKDRIKSIANNSTGFVYYVTLRGVTGASNLNIDEITENIEEIKKYASVPTLAGFGIKSPDDARLLSSCSDGVIIGSSIVQMIEESSQSKEFDRIGQYISELKQAIS
ncbi:MAG: tryptophan synthase subunit alpha [SAR86 cluster bacterium]|uniref:Tryptophan synthase alpha chain n=1 Tax=SAR86 cluster bacterium TaxID=2030880 RepID=A0A520N4F9_9GAMM|nr:MAG: tryptophan synthase subunit alpha [SAR86 cluster bacterium]